MTRTVVNHLAAPGKETPPKILLWTATAPVRFLPLRPPSNSLQELTDKIPGSVNHSLAGPWSVLWQPALSLLTQKRQAHGIL